MIGSIQNPSKKSPNSSDRISNLPEAVIGHILSCLPTKDVVQTCVLSKDWKYKWTSTYKLDIADTHSEKGTFVNFMGRVLSLVEHVREFRLSCEILQLKSDFRMGFCSIQFQTQR